MKRNIQHLKSANNSQSITRSLKKMLHSAQFAKEHFNPSRISRVIQKFMVNSLFKLYFHFLHNCFLQDPSKPFECEVCFFRYSSQKKLNSHTKSKHSHQEPQPELPKKSPICEFCGKSFCSSSALKKHLKRSCSKLDLILIIRSSLTNIFTEKLLTCSKCGFKYSENLNIQCRCTTHQISQLKNIEKRKVKEESFEQITTQSSIDCKSAESL